jgi:hypothetical protein
MKDLLVIMGASREAGTMKTYREQLTRAGIDSHIWQVLDWDESSYLGFQCRKFIELARQFIFEYRLLIFTDAWDVTFFGKKDDVIRKIPLDRVLWGAERNCFPDQSLAAKMPGDTAWKFVNGGMMAGTPENVIEFFTQVSAQPGYNPNLLNQGFFNTLKYNHSPLIHTDDRTKLFYCLYGEKNELRFDSNGNPQNSSFDTQPNFIHANGNWPTASIWSRREQAMTKKDDLRPPDSKMLASVGLRIGLPFCGRPVSPAWALSMSCVNYPMNTNRIIHATNEKEIGEARNEIAEGALRDGAKYLWFVDDDVSVPAHAAKALIGTLENADNKSMVCGGIYCAKSLPTEPIVYRGEGVGAFWRWKIGDVFECTSIGTGCMMIRTELLNHIERPWFKTVDIMETVGQPSVQITDDMYFCQKVQAAGFKILADTNVLTTHWEYDRGANKFIPYFFPEDCYPMRPVSEDEPRCERRMQ